MLRKLAIAPLLALLVACSSLGLAPAQSFEDRLAYAYGNYTAVMDTAASSVTAGTLSKADGAQVLKLGDEARLLLDAAKMVGATDPAAGNAKLALATAILAQLRNYLNARKPA